MPISSNLSSASSTSSKITGLPNFTDKAAQLISDIQSKFGKRNAVRHNNILGHKFEEIVLKEPTYCSQCSKFIWGVISQSCKLCKLISHEKCLRSINFECRANEDSHVGESHHHFQENYFLRPRFCNHCGILLKGCFEKQGLECGQCKIAIHRGCNRYVNPKCNLEDRVVDVETERQDWGRIQISDFDIYGLLGTGAFSKVYLARLRSNGREFAIKVLKKTNTIVQSDPGSVFTEREALQLGRQFPFLTIAHCCFQARERLFFVMEYVEGKDLVYHLRKARKFTEDTTRFYAAELVLALSYLHRRNYVYRDLKLDNVILDKQGHCKLLDFGLSKNLRQAVNMRTRTFCGTPSYMSPEIIKEHEYDFSVDWWTMGVLMYEMLTGCSPFGASDSEDTEALYRSIIRDDVIYPEMLSLKSKSILRGFLTKDPQNRLGCQILEGGEQAIFEHPFFMFKDENLVESHRWLDIQAKRIKPPQLARYDPSEEHYEPSYENSIRSLSPVSSTPLKNVSQEDFAGFSLYSSNFESMLESDRTMNRII